MILWFFASTGRPRCCRSQAEYLSWRPPQRPGRPGEVEKRGTVTDGKKVGKNWEKGGRRFFFLPLLFLVLFYAIICILNKAHVETCHAKNNEKKRLPDQHKGPWSRVWANVFQADGGHRVGCHVHPFSVMGCHGLSLGHAIFLTPAPMMSLIWQSNVLGHVCRFLSAIHFLGLWQHAHGTYST